MSQDALVVFTPSGKKGRFAIGTPILQAARELGVDLDSVCGGRGMCGRCQITPSFGSFAKFGVESDASHLNAITKTELRYDEVFELKEGRRLGCSTTIEGDLVIDVPPESQVHRQVVRKEADTRELVLNPATRLYYVEVQEPDMHIPMGDLQRLKLALAQEWSLNELKADLQLIDSLQEILRDGHWKVTVAIHHGEHIIGIWPGLHDHIYGIAVDVGSTTIAAHLSDLTTGKVIASAGLMNPQIRFGEDLMSRVSYIQMNPGGDKEMTAAVRETIQQLAIEVCAQAPKNITTHDIIEATFVGNPVMHHLLLGINPIELGGAPFALATDEAIEISAHQMGLQLHPGARVYVLPCIAGHVGADTAGVILSEAPEQQEEMTLLVDVGTNAEIVLGNKDRLLACSSPTGPAFEGAQISSGQRAAPGAIERIRIDPDTLEPRFKIIGSDYWSNEEEFNIDAAKTGITGICGSGIIEVVAEMFLAGIISTDGVINGDLAAKSPRIQQTGRTYSYLVYEGEQTIAIQQNDIRAIQLAKAALYAGVKLLMDHLKIDSVERIRLAGAFGTHIDVKYAMVLGLIPDCPLDKVSSAGNAAGAGARMALLDTNSRKTIETVVKNIEKVETALEPKFQQHFVDAMGIPNSVDRFENLAKVVDLPAPSKGGSSDDSGKRRRRRKG